MHMIPYNRNDSKTPGTGFHHEGLWLRYGIVQSVDVTTGLVTLEWLDYPGVRSEVDLSQPTLGIIEIPTVGAVVLVGFDQGFKAHIVRYIPVGYAKQRATGDIPQLHPGAKIFLSYIAESQVTGDLPVPVWTGTYMHMNNIGDIELVTASGESWRMVSNENIIDQNSMNYKVQTEAGILEFGLTKRLLTGTESTIIATDGTPFTNTLDTDPDALTEFRLRVLKQADANFLSDPEVDDPFIELTLGVKVDNDANIVKTDTTHVKADKKIVIQLKTKTGDGFEFTVDEDGNLTLKTNASMKIETSSDLEIKVGGQLDITVPQGAVNIDASSVKLIGDKAVVLEEFIGRFNEHQHISAAPSSSTSPPTIGMIPALVPSGAMISKKVKVE